MLTPQKSASLELWPPGSQQGCSLDSELPWVSGPDSGQQSPCERYQADQRSSLVSAQTGSWVRVTKRGRKANSPQPGSSPVPYRQRLGAGGRRVLPWAPFSCPGHGAAGLWGCGSFGFTFSLHLIDKEQSFKKFLFLKNLEGAEMPVRGRQGALAVLCPIF